MKQISIIELDKVRGKKLQKLYEQARAEALQEFDELKTDPLFMSGLMLYWGVGDIATKHHIRLSNTDPLLVGVYLQFLRKICGVPEEKIRFQLAVYPDIDTASNERFWSFATGIPLRQFTKSIVQSPRKGARGGQGVCTVIVSSAYLKLKMLEWLSIVPKELMKR